MSNIIARLTNSNPMNPMIAQLQSNERGQSLMEMALVLLFLLSLTFGLIDFSRAVYTASVVKAAAQEGARAGIIDTGDIMTAIESKMIGLDMASAAVDIDTSQLDIVEVTVVYDYIFLTPMIAGFVDSLALTGNASMVTQ